MSAQVIASAHVTAGKPASGRVLLILFALALAIRGLSALPQTQPGYMDAAYYYEIGANLARGRGFTEDFAWNYLTHPTALPQPSNAYWMPLTSILIAPFLWLPLDGYRAAQIPIIVLAALLVPLSYALSLWWFSRRDWAWTAALLMLASAFYAPFWTAIDSFALYGLIGMAVTWLVAGLNTDDEPASIGTQKSDASALMRPRVLARAALVGVLIALGHLTRADGFLLFAVFGAVWRRERAFVKLLVVALASYLVVMAPWFIRNMFAFGAPLAGGGSIFLQTYNDLFAYDQPLTLAYWLSGGPGQIAGNVGRAFVLNTSTLAGALHFVFFPLAVIGLMLERRRPMVRGAAIYLATLLFITTVVFSLSGPRGTFLHSLTAVLPVLYVLAPRGLSATISWIAARRRNWNAANAERVFGIAFVVMAILLSGSYYYSNVFGGGDDTGWNGRFAIYRQVDAFLRKEVKTDTGPIICINPPAYYYFNQQQAMALPSDDALALIHAAVQFKARYFVLEADHPEYLDGLYAFRAPDQRFQLRATFTDAAGAQVQLYQIVPLR